MKFVSAILLLLFFSFRALTCAGQEGIKPEPWTDAQLLEPEALSKILNDPTAKQPFLLCIGPGAVIRGSADLGPAHEKGNFEKLKQALDQLPKDAEIVIYCGCCPFEHCPNIRPAFLLLNEKKFTHQRLLNIQHNIKTDWIDKGYPVNKEPIR